MPAINDPDKEACRVAAVRAALLRDQRWKIATKLENFTVAGLRRRGQNGRIHGLDSAAMKWALRYCEAVCCALTHGP